MIIVLQIPSWKLCQEAFSMGEPGEKQEYLLGPCSILWRPAEKGKGLGQGAAGFAGSLEKNHRGILFLLWTSMLDDDEDVGEVFHFEMLPVISNDSQQAMEYMHEAQLRA